VASRIVIGYARSRAEGLLYEQLLRDRGVPAFSEMGIAFGEFAEAAQCRIYADADVLTAELVEAIREVMGSSVADINMAGFDPRPEPGEPKFFAAAWFVEQREAEMYAGLLQKRGIGAKVARAEDGGDKPFGLFVPAEITAAKVAVLRDYLGDLLDEDAIPRS